MGLDTVELVLAYEEAFGIAIPNAEAERIQTPRNVIYFVESELSRRRQQNQAPALPEPCAVLTREEIAGVIREITCKQLGLAPGEYGEDKHFVEDFGADYPGASYCCPMNLSCAVVLVVTGSWVFSAGAGEMLREPQRIGMAVTARIAKLQAEIAALDAQVRGDSPEFEAELRAWEAKMAEPVEWSGGAQKRHAVPQRMTKIMELEPSERSDGQRSALAQYFRSRSKTVAAAQRAAKAKRAELAALRQAAH